MGNTALLGTCSSPYLIGYLRRMVLILSDAGCYRHLLPLTFTRPVGALRMGIRTNQESWAAVTGLATGFATDPSLSAAFPCPSADQFKEIHGGLLPTPNVVEQVMDLEPGQVLLYKTRPIAFSHEGTEGPAEMDWTNAPKYLNKVELAGAATVIDRPWHLFQHCGEAMERDLKQMIFGKKSEPLSATNTVIGDPSKIFLAPGARVEASILNTMHGPIYIGHDAEVMEGCMIRGPFALGDHAQLKMGAKVYGPTTIGPHSRMGGEVNNCVVQGYSNKGHDGFLGNSVLGEWCNLGADTNNSNLKNNYGNVRVWSYAENDVIDTGLQFCGLVMGDHSKCGINTMFNTGSIVGVCANIFGSDLPPNHIPSFSWGGAGGFQEYDLQKAIATAEKVMARRNVKLDDKAKAILQHIAHISRLD